MLDSFYRDYLAWVDAGAWSSEFQHDRGLCHALADWCHVNKINIYKAISLADKMLNQFTNAGLDHRYPFNESIGYTPYEEESMANACHLNPHRIAWVREHAK